MTDFIKYLCISLMEIVKEDEKSPESMDVAIDHALRLVGVKHNSRCHEKGAAIAISTKARHQIIVRMETLFLSQQQVVLDDKEISEHLAYHFHHFVRSVVYD